MYCAPSVGQGHSYEHRVLGSALWILLGERGAVDTDLPLVSISLIIASHPRKRIQTVTIYFKVSCIWLDSFMCSVTLRKSLASLLG